MSATPTRILSVNTASVRLVDIQGRRVATAIHKQPQPQAVEIGPLGLQGDEQADPSVHGGLAKAVYAYPSEHLAFWRTVRAQARVAGWDAEVPPGLMGENLTLSGLTERHVWIGDELHLPSGAVLVVTEPRQPCFKFNAAMGFAQASKMMVQSGYCGWYLGVRHPGAVRAGDEVRVVPGPRELALPDLFRAKMSRRRQDD
ncbi:MOSC domain-containing protein [Ideonella livida]|uniref:MOSC domain-containing protein n=1 Tax=Ideonella livida TaxID=2707176 RepID=A0A7C9PJD6_9BURK|nr:MOSC domain-containing protein [Ideonella livida]NDY93373.1 MOSC domain-containing protein [Ideonella livida]